MRKKLIISIFIILFILFIILSIKINDNSSQDSGLDLSGNLGQDSIASLPTDFTKDNSSVFYNGWLSTSGSSLVNKYNEKIQLKGVSSHGIQWFSDVITYNNLKSLKDDWHINVFRIAMYTDPNSLGYISNPDELKQKVYEIADFAIDLDMYVIIDWHILTDNNPQYYKDDAIKFFDEVSNKYSDTPNVIYEICNEPNGTDVTWNDHIRPYAQEVISTIRNNCPNSLIIVGTPDWCKKLDDVADNPLDVENVVYSFHFYSGSHSVSLKTTIDNCIDKGIPIFVSECGLTDATGDGNLFLSSFTSWINYLDSKNISWIYWSFSNKDESSAIISSDYVPFVVQNSTDDYNSSFEDNNSTVTYFDFSDYLTPAGQFVYDLLK